MDARREKLEAAEMTHHKYSLPLLAFLFVVSPFLAIPARAEKANEIYSFKVLGQTQDAVRFEVHYYYVGDHGTANLGLQAMPLLDGQPLGYWSYTLTPLLSGDQTAQIRVSVIPRAPSAYSGHVGQGFRG